MFAFYYYYLNPALIKRYKLESNILDLSILHILLALQNVQIAAPTQRRRAANRRTPFGRSASGNWQLGLWSNAQRRGAAEADHPMAGGKHGRPAVSHVLHGGASKVGEGMSVVGNIPFFLLYLNVYT